MMAELRELGEGKFELELDGTTYQMRPLSLNDLIELEDVAAAAGQTFAEWSAAHPFRLIRAGFYRGAKRYHPDVTEETIGEWIGAHVGSAAVQDAIRRLVHQGEAEAGIERLREGVNNST